mmetsp:Transcript_2527/g.3434  ORF Transcript_2527/g.3434 Transcript_2527/m.3434 type:complete len:117 (-) Transcript_2527:127-477(-)
MAWPFCPQCEAILTLPEFGQIRCGFCGIILDFVAHFRVKDIITKSLSRPVPKWVENLENKGKNERAKRAVVDEQCPKCSHPEMEFYTMQLRSVDEGQTVFYECLNSNCQHKFSVNN